MHYSALSLSGGRSSASCKNVRNVSGKRSWEWWPRPLAEKLRATSAMPFRVCWSLQEIESAGLTI